MKKLNVIELYAGTGRASEPFRQWSSASVSLLVDWNQHALNACRNNFPDVRCERVDLATASAKQLAEMAGGAADIILGCPPCQGFSESGKRDDADPRNDHMVRFASLATGLDPLAIGMENVPRAAASPHFKQATRILENSGYVWTAGVLNAALYGSAQSRHRLVLVAFKKDLAIDPALPSPTYVTKGSYFDYSSQALKDYISADDELVGTTASMRLLHQQLGTNYFPSEIEGATPTFDAAVKNLPRLGSSEAAELGHIPWSHGPKILDAMEKIPEGGRRETEKEYFGAAYARLHRKGLARTITTYFSYAGSGRYWHPTCNRAITLREAARLQGFPDSFRFQGGPSEANRILVGNALDGKLAEATYRAIRQGLG